MPPISISINVEKVDKSKFFKGKKGKYLDLVLFETPESEYGDYLVKQRGNADEKLPILGNGKFFEPKGKKKKTKSDDEESGNKDNEPW